MLARKVFLQFFSDNLVNLLGFISTFYIARFMGPSVLGTVGYSLSLLSILSIFSDLGFSQAHIKRVSEREDLKGKIGTFLSIRIILAVVFTLTSFIYLIFFSQTKTVQDLTIYLSFFIFYLANNFASLATATFQGLSKTSLNNLPLILGRLTKTISVIIISLLSLGTVWVSVTYSLDGLMVLIISIILLLKITGPLKPNLKYLKNYASFAMPMAGLSILSYLIGNIDKLLINNFWSTKDVGLYFGIQSLMSLPQSMSNALMTLLFPRFSELQKENNIQAVKFHLKEAIRYLSIITLPIVLVSLFYNKEIPALLFGKEYTDSAGIFITASLTVIVINLTRPYSNLLFALEKGKYMLLIGVVNLIVVLVSDILLIPQSLFGFTLFGLKGTGAAIGILNMWLVNAVLTMFLVNKYYKVTFYDFIPKILFVSVFSVTSFVIIKIFLPSGLLGLLTGVVSFMAIYLISIYKTSLITKTDIKYFKDIISPVKMKNYIKEEVTN